MSVLRTANVPAGASVAVIGLGGVGMSAVMGAVVAGASPIVAVDRVAEKLERAGTFGATHTVAAGEDQAVVRDSIAKANGGARPDFVFDCIGLPSTAELAIESTGPGGTAVLVGIPATGERAAFDVGELIDRSAQIVGSNYGWAIPDQDFPRLAGLFLEGRLPIDRLIDERIGLDEVNSALEALRAGKGLRRVIVF
jgi:S-(hydroxymethyl)glutathione dehydrogenase/alcohol dehydrogenase